MQLDSILTESELSSIPVLNKRKPAQNKIYKGIKSTALVFQYSIWEYLNNNKSIYKISKVISLNAADVDGIVILENGATILIEVKYALNWFKCCNARTEIQLFLRKKKYLELIPEYAMPSAGLIIFKEFSSDWKNIRTKDQVERGWINFYDEQKYFNSDFKIDIIQFNEGKLFNNWSKQSI